MNEPDLLKLENLYYELLVVLSAADEAKITQLLNDINSVRDSSGNSDNTLNKFLKNSNSNSNPSLEDITRSILSVVSSVQLGISNTDESSSASFWSSWTKGNVSGRLAEVALYIFCFAYFGLFGILAMITVPVTKFGYRHMKEIYDELANNQRVVTNLATLTLTALAVGGVIALLVSNPVGWGVSALVIAAFFSYWSCVAALAVTRQMNNTIDCYLNGSKTKLPGDSRFQLSATEEAAIRKKYSGNDSGNDSGDVAIIETRLALRALAQKVINREVDNKEVTQQLAKLKKGDLDGAAVFTPPKYATNNIELKFFSKGANNQKSNDTNNSNNSFKISKKG